MKGNSKLLSVLSYITWIGWLIAFFARDRSDRLVRQHVNQALVLNIISVIINVLNRLGGLFDVIGNILGLACLVFLIWGIVRAVKGSDEPLPFVGDLMHIQ